MGRPKENPPSDWANARPLGGDVYWLPMSDSDTGQKYTLIWHWCEARKPGPGWTSARTIDHQHISFDPLHIEPSLLCKDCGWHGFIRDGQWASV